MYSRKMKKSQYQINFNLGHASQSHFDFRLMQVFWWSIEQRPVEEHNF